MEKLQVTSKDFEQAYAALTERLKDDIKHMEDVAADVTTAEQALEKSCCNLSKLDTALDDLQNELTSFEVEKGLHEMDIRKPIKVDVKDLPDDE
jgi:chromosome segregation ATPase